MSDIQQEATEKVDDDMGTSEVPDWVREDAIIDEARRILMRRNEEQEADCND